MNRHLKLTLAWLLVLWGCCFCIQAHTWTNPSGDSYAYVVCGNGYFSDHRVYRVDIDSGKLTGTSRPIEWMAYAHTIAYDPNRSFLYAASYMGLATDYWPLTVLRVQDGDFEVVARYSTNPEDTKPRGSGSTYVGADGEYRHSPLNPLPHEIYRLVVSPDGGELYLSHGGLVESECATEVWEARTGKVLRRLRQIPPQSRAWSPDGAQVAGFWAGEEPDSDEPQEYLAHPSYGGVYVKDSRTLELLSEEHLKNNQGLQPPWGRIDRPFIFKEPLQDRMRVYDRDTGEPLSNLDLNELVKVPGASHVYLNEEGGGWEEINSQPVLENPTELPISVTAVFLDPELPENIRGGGHERGYVVLLDIVEPREVWRVEVGVRCSNAVVAFE